MKQIFIFILTLLLIGCSSSTQLPDSSEIDVPTPSQTPEVTYDSEPVAYYMDGVEDIEEELVPMMNTMVKLTVYQGDAEMLYQDAYNTMTIYHKLLDGHHYYRDQNDDLVKNIKMINDSYATGTSMEVSQEMIEILTEAIHMSELSKGYFNPMMGSLIDLWTPKFSPFPIENTDPTNEEIQVAKACVPHFDQLDDVLEINKEKNTVTFHKLEGCQSKVSLNLGAFSKGYIVDKTKEALSNHDAVWLLDAGTSTVVGVDQSENKTWTAGVRSPYNKAAMLYALTLQNNQVLSSSGDDNSYFLLNTGDDTLVRCHILNPFTGVSENTYRSASVLVKDNATISDVLSTVMFTVSDKNEAFEIINNFEKNYQTDISVSWVRETDKEFKLAAVESTQTLHDAMIDETVMEAVENVILLKEEAE